MLVRCSNEQHLLQLGPSLVGLRSPLGHLYFAELFNYGVHDCEFELRLSRHAQGIFAGWHNVKLFVIPS